MKDEKFEKEFEEIWSQRNPLLESDRWQALKESSLWWYLHGRRKGQEEIDLLIQRVKQLERLLCISHDYLRGRWEMTAEPLCQIDEVVKEILKRDRKE